MINVNFEVLHEGASVILHNAEREQQMMLALSNAAESVCNIPAILARYDYPTDAAYLRNVLRGSSQFIREHRQKEVSDWAAHQPIAKASRARLIQEALDEIPQPMLDEIVLALQPVGDFIRLGYRLTDADYIVQDGSISIDSTQPAEYIHTTCRIKLSAAQAKDAKAFMEILPILKDLETRYQLQNTTATSPVDGSLYRVNGILTELMSGEITEDDIYNAMYQYPRMTIY